MKMKWSKKKQLTILSAALMCGAACLMTLTKGIVMYSQAGPGAEPVPHFFTFLDPPVYLAGGVYFAPLAVLLAVLSLVFLVAAVLKSSRGAAAFAVSLACFVCLIGVLLILPPTILNIAAALLAFISTGVTYWTSFH